MLLDETVLSFAEAAKTIPTFNGKRCHTSTIWRWARRGCQGVKLEVRRLGGRFVTSREALDRFSKELGDIPVADRPKPNLPPKATTRQRARSVERANQTLKAAGIL